MYNELKTPPPGQNEMDTLFWKAEFAEICRTIDNIDTKDVACVSLVGVSNCHPAKTLFNSLIFFIPFILLVIMRKWLEWFLPFNGKDIKKEHNRNNIQEK